jgi:hypothetical protein
VGDEFFLYLLLVLLRVLLPVVEGRTLLLLQGLGNALQQVGKQSFGEFVDLAAELDGFA